MVALLLLLSLASAHTAEAQPASAAVTVSEEKSTYHVLATFAIDRRAADVMAVLTDYARIPEFMPDIERTVVRERGDGHAVVEQDASAHFAWFSKRIHVVLDVVEEPMRLRFRDRCGDSFTRYDGAWRLATDGDRTLITYELTAEPSFKVPGFVLKKLLARNSTKMVEGLRREVVRRASPAIP